MWRWRDEIGGPREVLGPATASDEGSLAPSVGRIAFHLIQSLLDAAVHNPEIETTLVQTAVVAEDQLNKPLFEFRNNGRPMPPNGARWGPTISPEPPQRRLGHLGSFDILRQYPQLD
jgi:hypothetical protein